MPRKKSEPREWSYVGRAVDEIDSHGIKRRISLHRVEKDSVALTFETWWDGEDKEPFRNAIRLSMPALNAALCLLTEFSFDPSLFPAPTPKA